MQKVIIHQGVVYNLDLVRTFEFERRLLRLNYKIFSGHGDNQYCYIELFHFANKELKIDLDSSTESEAKLRKKVDESIYQFESYFFESGFRAEVTNYILDHDRIIFSEMLDSLKIKEVFADKLKELDLIIEY